MPIASVEMGLGKEIKLANEAKWLGKKEIDKK
jgi:hypothetical protein